MMKRFRQGRRKVVTGKEPRFWRELYKRVELGIILGNSRLELEEVYLSI
jgi:hypothetical protein